MIFKKKEVIEPSEIIVEDQDEEKSVSSVNPWIRFLARMCDYSLLGIIIAILQRAFFANAPLLYYNFKLPLIFFLWMPIEALLLSAWGYTPGKYLTKTVLLTRFHRKISFMGALRRALMVWVRGMGLGIPILAFFTMGFAYYNLKSHKITSWDHDEKLHVRHYYIEPWRILLALAIIIIGAVNNFLHF